MTEEQTRTIMKTAKSILTSRRGLSALAVTIGCIMAVGPLTKSLWNGTITIEYYYEKLEVLMGLVVASWLFYSAGTAFEDGKEKSGPNQQIAIGDNAKSQSIKVPINYSESITTPIPSEGVDTDPQSPKALK